MTTDGRPRLVIIKVHRSRDIATIMSVARSKGQLEYEDQLLRIAPDISPAVSAVRGEPSTRFAQNLLIRFKINFPAMLVFKVIGIQKMLEIQKMPKIKCQFY